MAGASDFSELLGDLPSESGKPAPSELRASDGAGSELAMAGDAYEGASQFSKELASYAPAIRSADADLVSSKRTADVRIRDTLRNDAYVQGGATLRKDNIVGDYFMLNARPNSRRLFGKEDNTWEDEHAEEVEELFAAWAESYDNWADAARQNTLTGLVRMALDQHLAAGETLGTVEWLRDEPRTFSTAIQMVDTDRMITPPEFMSAREVRMGVRRNQFGAPQGIYLRMAHPSDWLSPEAYQHKYIPLRKPWGRLQVIHIFEQMRPDQSRGMSLAIAALSEMRMTKKFRQMVLQNAVVNATYAATIESELPTEAIFHQLGGTDIVPEAIQGILSAYMAGHYGTLEQFMAGAKNLHIDGTKIPHLPPGSKLNLRGAGQGGPLGTEFEQSLLRHIAASLGVSYEQLSRDYTSTNYSSARAAMNETYKAMTAIKRMVADRFASTIYRLWYEEAYSNGVFTTLPRRAPSFWEGLNAEFYTACDWVGASKGQIDEYKETQAAALRMQVGISTLQDENARLGKDWRKQLRQMKREQEWKDFYGVMQEPVDAAAQANGDGANEATASAISEITERLEHLELRESARA